ncbi:interferon-induced protein with tetratricopeptide repeats 5-like [Pelobates fuscus]|uniref:interferon-induced protein with tetratricopeptide repeats 5-like n=1 Tax=Pelobates fuscus TaxID=191477 RepID=UPI002FE4A5BF
MASKNIYDEIRNERKKRIDSLFKGGSPPTEYSLNRKFVQLEHLLEKETRKWWEITSLEQYLASNIIPRGLRVLKVPAFGLEDHQLMKDWHQASDECSKKYMVSLIDYQRRSLTSLEDEIKILENDISNCREPKAVENNYSILKEKIKTVDEKISTTKSTKFKRDQDDYQKVQADLDKLTNNKYHLNLNKKKRDALRRLTENPNIIIKEADKGGGTVIMDRSYYMEEAYNILNDTNTATNFKTCLLQLNCHFTWDLIDGEIDEIEERLQNQLKFLVRENKHMVYNLLAYIKHLQSDYTESIANLDEAERNCLSTSNGPNGKLLVIYGNYAWVHYYLNQLEKSQLYIDKVNNVYKELKHTENRDDIYPEIYGEQGWSLLNFNKKYYEKAKDCFEKALKEAPEYPEWNSGYATAVYRLESFQNVKSPGLKWESLNLLKRAIELNPKDSVVKALLGLRLQDLKRTQEGLTYIEEALQQTPNLPYLLRYVAIFYRRAGMIDEALHVLKTAVSLIPNSGFHHYSIGLCYRSKMSEKKTLAKSDFKNIKTYSREIQELLQKAIFHFKKGLECKKTYMYAYIGLANMYTEANEYKKAEETFQTVLSFTNLTDNEKQQIHFHYGNFEQFHKKSEKEAIRHYKEALLIPGAFYNKQRCEQALKKLAERKVTRDPTDASGFSLLGFVYKIQKKSTDAIECYGKALKLDPHNEEYLSNLCELKLAI